MKKIISLLLLVPVFYVAQAQENNQTNSTPSPDFPGSIVFEYGLNYFTGNDNVMRTNPWHSATYNLYYFYPFKLGESRYSFNPGFGIGTEKFGFEEKISFQDSSSVTVMRNITDLPRFDSLIVSNINKSQIMANYFDIPFEFRFHARKNDHKNSFYIALGCKVGVNFNGKTKIKYTELDNQKTYKDIHNFNVNRFRYGAVARIGGGPFNAWIQYSGSKLFRKDKFTGFQNPNVWSWGISLTTF